MKIGYPILALPMLAQAAWAVTVKTYLAVDCTGPVLEEWPDDD